MTKNSTPESILPDGVDCRQFGGVDVHKGSVAAFVANAQQLLQMNPASAEYRQTAESLKNLVPALRAVGVLDIFTAKSDVLAQLIDDAQIQYAK